jgi:hypothetical protein
MNRTWAVVAAGNPPVRRIVFHYGAEQFAVSLKPAAGTNSLYARFECRRLTRRVRLPQRDRRRLGAAHPALR